MHWQQWLACQYFTLRTGYMGTTLVVQWLRLHAPNTRAQVQCLFRELGSHMARGAVKNLNR